MGRERREGALDSCSRDIPGPSFIPAMRNGLRHHPLLSPQAGQKSTALPWSRAPAPAGGHRLTLHMTQAAFPWEHCTDVYLCHRCAEEVGKAAV